MIQKSVNWVWNQLKKLFAFLLGKKKAPIYAESIIDAANNKSYVESYSKKAVSNLDLGENRWLDLIRSSASI